MQFISCQWVSWQKNTHTYSEEREGEKKQIDFLRIYLVDCQTKGAEQVIFGKKKKN